MGMKAWAINDLAINLGGVPLDSGGYADDEVMSLEWDSAQYEDFVGADGEVSRYPTGDFRATVTLRYAHTADANDRLTAILQADLALPNGGGAGVFMAKDLEGRTVVTSERAWVMGFPDWKAAKGVQIVEWKIRLASGRATVIGGR